MDSLAAVAQPGGNVVLEHEVIGDPGPGQLLLKAAYSTLSPGTESALLAGHILPLPQHIGYSLAAHVVAVGVGVQGFREGDAVVATARHAQYQLIDAYGVTPVPEGTDLEQAAFFNLAHTALYAIRRADIRLGEAALVMGQGLVGAITAQLAKLAGAVPVVVTETDSRRLDLARANWADVAINPLENPRAIHEAMASLGLDGFPVVFEATGMRAPLEQAVDLVSERGRVMMISTTGEATPPGLTEALMMKGATLIGGYINSKPFSLQRRDMRITDQWPPSISAAARAHSTPDVWTSDLDIRAVLDLIRFGRLDLRSLVSHRFSVGQIPDAYALVKNKDSALLGGVIDWR